MTVREVLAIGENRLKSLDTPHLDAALLLAHACGVNRERLYMKLPDTLTPEDITAYNRALHRRETGEPVAWITGTKEFWGLPLQVGPGVLCPRPDSEILVETALKYIPVDRSYRLHDCCTGPGTLAIAIANERPLLTASASDISKEAAQFISLNNYTLADGRIRYIEADLLEGINGPFDMIISNPPYLTEAETSERMKWGWKEPELALNGGGEDGLSIISTIIRQSVSRLVNGGFLILEASPLQILSIRDMLATSGFHTHEIYKDLGGHARVIIARIGVVG